jgi:hypothetical protein
MMWGSNDDDNDDDDDVGQLKRCLWTAATNGSIV